MNILSTQYTISRRSLEIYLAGCKGICGNHCIGCHNPETWSFNQGEEYTCNLFLRLKSKIFAFDNMIDNIEIFGGEPNDQNLDELKGFLTDLKFFNKKIWLFTRYKFEDLPQFELELCDYIKCGAYIPKLTCTNNFQYGIHLATSNQKIYKKGIDY